MGGDKVTAEQVKELVRRYAEQEFPGWRAAGAFITIGELGSDDREILLVKRVTSEATDSSPLPFEPSSQPGL